MKSTAVIVFLKAPRPGKVKTRLTPFLSAHEAASFYRSIAADTVEFISTCASKKCPIQLWLAWDGPTTTRDIAWIPLRKNQYQLIRQKGRTLGERLIHAGRMVSQRMKESPVIFIGTDCLELTPSLISKSVSFIRRPTSVVIGPAGDGGYYLIGMHTMTPSVFENIDWSTSKVFSQTRIRMKKAKMSTALLPKQSDIDVPADLMPFLKGQKKISQFFPRTNHWMVDWNASRK